MEPRDWISLASILVSLTAILLTLARNSRQEMQALANRLTKLEADFKALPSKDSFHKLELDVTAINGQLNVIDERMKPQVEALRRIENFIQSIDFIPAPRRKAVKK